jgi:hypothetical protein
VPSNLLGTGALKRLANSQSSEVHMKRIALAVAIGTLLVSPVVLAQSSTAPDSMASKAKSKDIEAEFLKLEENSSPKKEKQRQEVLHPEGTEQAVAGSFDDPTVEDARPGNGSPVTGSFVDPTSF